MTRAQQWTWGTFVGISALALTLTHSVAIALTLGLVSGMCAGISTVRATAQWKRRAEAFAAAARGISVDPGVEGGSGDDPVRLAHEVQDAAITSRENTRKLSVLRAVIDGMAEGVWITSEDGTVIEHNNALKEFLYTGQEIVGHRPRDLLESAELQEAVERACRDHAS